MEWLLGLVCGLMCFGFLTEDSGEYYCEYQKTIASWEILVRDVGYRESVSRDAVLILNVALNVGLFLFSSIGSIILLMDYRKQHKLRNERKEEGEGEMVNEVEDAVATDSVYTALEHGTSSIYNVLDPSANDMDQTCVQQTDNSQKEDGIFESVYENF
ncbi:uncharacterized protein si:ch211-243a20.4 isoform X2 [Conger conger]|uniref:uncharacterized protein si:ch211-243a20.4 isoform X2 n=1 Tax=Conger conger TaxID=82655 RepID=UPI002A5AB4DF|nr:uncharacterized protein si:ch211-243a20.4 isoform X2 [Conger conger]